MKFIRYILFILISFLAVGIVYWAFGYLFALFFIGLSTFWLIFILISFQGILWGLFQGLLGILMYFTSMISPNRMFSFYTILIISLMNGLRAIYITWTLNIKYSGSAIFGAIVVTILLLEITFALVIGSYLATKDEY